MREAQALVDALNYTNRSILVKLVPCVSKRAASDKEALQWKRNIAALEGYIREKLPKAR